MTRNLIIISLLIFTFIETSAQQLLSPSYSYSKKKTSYITLTDGTEIQGTIRDIDREKGLIKFIKIKDGSGKKHKLKPESVKFMYLPQTAHDKYVKAIDILNNVQKWSDETLNQDILNQGYVYFELADVKIKKKNKKLLMQLLNPGFSKQVKVYHDPYASETMSAGIGSITIVGGKEKSYYIAKGNNPAYKLKKKNYKKEFLPLWNSCENVISDYPDQKWSNLTKHIITFSECKG